MEKKPSRANPDQAPNTQAPGSGKPAAKPTAARQAAPAAAQGAQAEPAEPADEAPSHDESIGLKRFVFFQAVPAWMVSMIMHTLIIFVLWFITLDKAPKKKVEVYALPEDIQEVVKVEEVKIETADVQTFEDAAETEVTETELTSLVEDVEMIDTSMASEFSMEMNEFPDAESPLGEAISNMQGSNSTGLSGRGAARRSEMVRENGGTAASEQAVQKALKWIAAHQLAEDGGWNFDHTIGGGSHRRSPNPGHMAQARNAATAMALLPFLGAGQTHLEGEYKNVVKAGLNFLIKNQKPKANGGSFAEPGGNLYSHGLASIVICEAYGMTKDSQLIAPAQASLNYIAYAQDPVGGGWRYQPRQSGDTSVVGWQLMALKSGHMGYLQVSPQTIQKSVNYLDSVSADSGAFYGYTTPGRGRATTAIGLLSRMYLGWDQNHPSLERGVQHLQDIGPSVDEKADMYYNYYATQVIRHYLDKEFKDSAWNKKMRTFLVKKQSSSGVSKGSWFFKHHFAEHGGRLYCTALSAMVLEVYYRHMPIYGKKASVEEFPLD